MFSTVKGGDNDSVDVTTPLQAFYMILSQAPCRLPQKAARLRYEVWGARHARANDQEQGIQYHGQRKQHPPRYDLWGLRLLTCADCCASCRGWPSCCQRGRRWFAGCCVGLSTDSVVRCWASKSRGSFWIVVSPSWFSLPCVCVHQELQESSSTASAIHLWSPIILSEICNRHDWKTIRVDISDGMH